MGVSDLHDSPLIRLPGPAATCSPLGALSLSSPFSSHLSSSPLTSVLPSLLEPCSQVQLLSKPTAQLLLASPRGRGIWFLSFLWREQKGGRWSGKKREAMGEGGREAEEERRNETKREFKQKQRAKPRKRKGRRETKAVAKGVEEFFPFISRASFSTNTKVASFPDP